MTSRKTKLATAMITLGILLPQGVAAYYSPEEVLFNKDLYLPPTARETQDRSNIQMQETSLRREREQEAAFALQRPEPIAPVIVEEPAPAAAQPAFFAIPYMQGADGAAFGFPGAPANNTADAELLRTVRLLGRIRQNQESQVLAQVLHSAAGTTPLAPTGAPAILTATAMIGSVLWTMKRAKRAGRKTRV